MLIERLLNCSSNALKGRLGRSLLLGTEARAAQPLAPGAKQHALQLAQGQHLGVGHTRAQAAKGPFEGLENAVALGDQATIELQGREHAGGHQPPKPGFLLAVAKHGDLANPVGDPLLLQPQPHLLAIGAPGMVVAKQGDPHALLRLTKQTQTGLGAGGSVDQIGWGRRQTFELVPAQLSVRHRRHPHPCSSLGSSGSRPRWRVA